MLGVKWKSDEENKEPNSNIDNKTEQQKQLLPLESLFSQDHYPDMPIRLKAAIELKITEKNVYVSEDKVKCGKYIFIICFPTELVPKLTCKTKENCWPTKSMCTSSS